METMRRRLQDEGQAMMAASERKTMLLVMAMMILNAEGCANADDFLLVLVTYLYRMKICSGWMTSNKI